MAQGLPFHENYKKKEYLMTEREGIYKYEYIGERWRTN